MMPPIRCFSCGKPIGHLFENYNEKISQGKDPSAVLDELGIKRYCCRRMFISYIDLSDEIIHYKGY